MSRRRGGGTWFSYHGMVNAIRDREWLEEQRQKEYLERKEKLKEACQPVSDALEVLKDYDPEWEKWYDSEAVPEFDAFDPAQVQNVVKILVRRILEITAGQPDLRRKIAQEYYVDLEIGGADAID